MTKKKSGKPINIAKRLRAYAETDPEKKAFIYSTGKKVRGRRQYKSLSFSQFEAQSNKYANAFLKAGLKKGTKTVLIQKAGADLYSIIYGLLKIGSVPVLVDSGMGLKNVLDSIESI